MALAGSATVDDPRPRRLTRWIVRTAWVAVVAGAAVAAAVTTRPNGLASTARFEVLFDESARTPVPVEWRRDGRLRRSSDAGSETFDRWRLAGPPDISFDGRRVLFASAASGTSPAGIWEMSADGGATRQLLACPSGCATPRYLPSGRIVFAAPTSAASDADEALFTIQPDGHERERITYGRGRDRVVAVLADGRIAFERRRLAGEAEQAPLLMTVQPDGTGVSAATSPPPRAMSVLASPRAIPPVATSVVDPRRDTGLLLCLDTWLTMRDGRPFRRAMADGHVRVIDAGRNVVLGDAPIAPDGSFYVEVPANRALRLQTIDAAGSIVATLDSGIWVRPNEQRGCIGCHEPASLAPANRFPQALHAGAVKALGQGQWDLAPHAPAGARP